MQEYTLTRTGQPPLSFTGELVAESEGRIASGREQNRWHDLRLYKTQAGKYVLSIEYHTQWQGELGHSWAEVVEPDSDYLLTVLQSFDPCEHVQGFPNHEAYAARQRELLTWIRRRFEAQVSELIDGLPEFIEKVD